MRMTKTYIMYSSHYGSIAISDDLATLSNINVLAVIIGYKAEFIGDKGIYGIRTSGASGGMVVHVDDVVSDTEGNYIRVDEIQYVKQTPSPKPDTAMDKWLSDVDIHQ